MFAQFVLVSQGLWQVTGCRPLGLDPFQEPRAGLAGAVVRFRLTNLVLFDICICRQEVRQTGLPPGQFLDELCPGFVAIGLALPGDFTYQRIKVENGGFQVGEQRIQCLQGDGVAQAIERKQVVKHRDGLVFQ